MQSLSCSYSKGSYLPAPYPDSDLVHYPMFWRKKKSGHGCLRVQTRNLTYRPFFNCRSQSYHRGSKMISLALVNDPEQLKHKDDEVISVLPVQKNPCLKPETAELVEKERVDVKALAQSLHDAKTADEVDVVLKNFDALPLPVFSSIIRGLGMDKRVDTAFAILDWLKKKGNHSGSTASPNLFIYNSLLGALKQAAQYSKIGEVMEEMRSQGFLPDIVTYNTLMSVYLDQGKPEEALKVFADIHTNGLTPSPATYSIVQLSYRNMNDAIGAIRSFVKFREEYEKLLMGNDPDDGWKTEFVKLENFTIRICYLVMRRHLVSEEDASTNLFKILTEMDKFRVRPGRVEYEKLIWACTRESHYNVARELYQRIRDMENDISLSVCNHVIWLMGKAKKWWAALEVYEDLLDKGPAPNNLSYDLIVSHFGILLGAAKRKGLWRWGLRLINKMMDKGLRPGIAEWNAVLFACSKASETSAAVQIFKRMIEHGEKPSVASYGALLSALEKGKLYDEAIQVWEHMRKVGVKPNLHAYTIVASVYIGNGMVEMVDCVLKEMSSSNIQPSIVTFNAIITACARKGMGGAAMEWFYRMKVQNVKPNEITYDMLTVALARDGKPRLAYDLYLRGTKEGLRLSPKSYDVVLQSSLAYGITIDKSALGPRPPQEKRSVRTGKDLFEFCELVDLPKKSKSFGQEEIYGPEAMER